MWAEWALARGGWTSITVDDVRGALAGSLDDPQLDYPTYLGGRDHKPALPERVIEAELPAPSTRPAAVLCPLFDDGGQAAVVLTRRSTRLRRNSGEVAFPGGRLDEGESPLEGALREAYEEVGIEPSSVEIIGRLRPLSTYNNPLAIRPFVGVLPGRPVLHPNPAEVERAFTVTLSELVRAEVYHDELWPVDGEDRIIHFFTLESDIVWGATGRMLTDLFYRLWEYHSANS